MYYIVHMHFVHTADILAFIQSTYEPALKVTVGGGVNNISMSQTCLYNVIYQQAITFVQQPVATEGIRL